jgi:hypothetical protein
VIAGKATADVVGVVQSLDLCRHANGWINSTTGKQLFERRDRGLA